MKLSPIDKEGLFFCNSKMSIIFEPIGYFYIVCKIHHAVSKRKIEKNRLGKLVALSCYLKYIVLFNFI